MDDESQLIQAMAALEAQRALLGDTVVESALGPMREKLAAIQSAGGEGQRKQATILFADISGFTALSETLDAEDVRDTMNALWQHLDAAITSHGGLIDKHIGDALMALWGAQTAREDDPERAIRAALAMQAALATFSAAQSVALRMRIGINTGPVLVGMVGTTNEFTAMGDTVNVASRLEHAAPVGGILIAHDTYRHVRGLVDVQVLDPITVKGKAAPIQTYLVERAKPRAFALGTCGVEGIETRMIGRDADLLRLQQAMRAVIEDRELQAITIMGEAGLGKSRLLYEVRSWIELLPESITLFVGRATPEMTRLPYALLRDLFAFRFAMQESDPAQVAREKFEAGVCRLLGEDGPDSIRQAHLIGHLLGIDCSDSPHLVGVLDSPRQLRHRALQALADLFVSLARRETILIALEDLHWADAASMDALASLADQWAELPILALYLARPTLLERRPAWGEGMATHTRLILHPLSRGDSRRLVAEILCHLPTIPNAVRDLIVSGAEGNPFYVEELIKMLIEQGVIIPGAETWQVGEARLAQVQVSPTLTGVLQARLDALPAAERTTLQQASVIGRIFWDQAVAQVRDAGDGEVRSLLADLRRRELVYRYETSIFAGATEYGFKHALLRDVTYETLLKAQRRRYHAQAAAWLITASGDRGADYSGLIAEHYAHASMDAEAAQWYQRAGDHAHARYAHADAIQHYQQALSLAVLPEQQDLHIHCWYRLGSVYLNLADYPQALQALRTAQHHALEQHPARSSILRLIGIALWRQGNYDDAQTHLSTSIQMAQADQDESNHALSLTQLGNLTYLRGDLTAAQALLEQAQEMLERLDNQAGLALVHNPLAVIAYRYGQYPAALDHLHASYAINEALGAKYGLDMVLQNMTHVYLAMGETAQAATAIRQGLVLSREVGDHHSLASSVMLAAAVLVAPPYAHYHDAFHLLTLAQQTITELGAVWEPEAQETADETRARCLAHRGGDEPPVAHRTAAPETIDAAITLALRLLDADA